MRGIRYFGVTRGRLDDARTLQRDTGLVTEVYERLTTGIGDTIMLRPGIIARIEKYPKRRHVAHIWSGVAPMLFDIENLEVVPIIVPSSVRKDQRALFCAETSASKLSRYSNPIVHQLSTPCAEYETDNAPDRLLTSWRRRLKWVKSSSDFAYRVPRPRLVAVKEEIAVTTGKRVSLSRQEIFCRLLGVDFYQDNYRVRFTKSEEAFATEFLRGLSNPVGIQMRSSEKWRDYKYMIELAEHIAAVHKGHVVTFDESWVYRGPRSSVRSLVESDLRSVWAVISKMDLFIGTDSSGVHMAGSTGVPVYGIYGPTDPSCRLLYPKAAWSDRWNMPILRTLRRGCGRQYCWYLPCRARPCLNTRTPAHYWRDALGKLGRYFDA